MSSPFVAEIKIVSFNFAYAGWAMCNGQLMPISQNTALFSLLGTNYGGDGKSTFGLPNFQGNAPMMYGQGAGLTDHFIGEIGGEQAITLLTTEIPAHTHPINANATGGTQAAATAGIPALDGATRGKKIYSTTQNGHPMNAAVLGPAGGSQPHNNMAPYLVLNFLIALQGIFPARS